MPSTRADRLGRPQPHVVVALGESETVASAKQELIRGVRGMIGTTLHV